MGLLFSGGRDQALLTKVIQVAHPIVISRGIYFGRTAIQKIMYFLKVLGVPMNYRFDIHHYGPFCGEILNDIEALLADDVINDVSKNRQKYSSYSPTVVADELVAAHAEDIRPYEEKIKELVNNLASLKPEYLELYATLDYLYRWYSASGDEGPWKDKVIEMFNEIKPGKFQPQIISKGYDTLVKAGLISD